MRDYWPIAERTVGVVSLGALCSDQMERYYCYLVLVFHAAKRHQSIGSTAVKANKQRAPWVLVLLAMGGHIIRLSAPDVAKKSCVKVSNPNPFRFAYAYV